MCLFGYHYWLHVYEKSYENLGNMIIENLVWDIKDILLKKHELKR